MGETTEPTWEIPAIAPKGGEPETFESDGNEGILKASILRLSFTPIIGSEASVIDRESTDSWRQMADEMREMLCQLSDTGMYDYLSSLMDAKCVSDATPYTGSRSATTAVHWEGKLGCLRRELIRLAHSANAAFGKQMFSFAVADTEDYSVLVSDSNDQDALTEYMVRTCLAALQVMNAEGEGHTDMCKAFDLRHVYERLVDFTRKFLGGQIPAPNDRPFSRLRTLPGASEQELKDVRQDLMSVQVANPCRYQVFLHQLGWLADMVFHSFSFRGSFYPTDEELSFRAALHLRNSDQRPPPISAFEKGWTALEDKIEFWYRQYQTGDTPHNSKMKDFYRALASVLILQDVRHRTNAVSHPFVPIAFSLNLDRELEKALEGHGLDRYYVAMPIEATTEPNATNDEAVQHQRWLLAEFCKGKKGYQPKWHWLPDDFGHRRVDRPLVVKLHGSPLHSLPEPVSREALDAGRTAPGPGEEESACCIAPPPSANYVYASPLKHLFTLSETSYLRHLVVLRNLPDFFDRVYQGKVGTKVRDFYFLGLSTSEWNTRLRMSDIVFPMQKGRIPPRKWSPRLMIAINEEFDDYRSVILDSLGIKRWYGSLSRVGEEIDELIRPALA